MEPSVPDRYLETEVMTATPQRRQLMLVEGAIRFIERTRHHWRAEQDDEARQCLLRAQRIMSELLSGLNHQVHPELTKRVAALYVFVFRTLVDANLHRDERKLDHALRVLQPQREAWQSVCDELGAAAPLENEAAVASLSAQGLDPRTPAVPGPSFDAGNLGQQSAGFSAEA